MFKSTKRTVFDTPTCEWASSCNSLDIKGCKTGQIHTCLKVATWQIIPLHTLLTHSNIYVCMYIYAYVTKLY